jgi:polysaccharide biosynthesis transport protein
MAEIGETELDVHALWRALWRRLWLLVLLAVLAAIGTYFALGFVDPLYTADTSILIEERESPITRRDQTASS